MKFLSQVYTIARGSVGGITYTANQYHQLIARARTSPVNPGSTLQTAIRSAFTGAETLWKALSEGDMDRWDNYAALTPRQNPLGPIFLTGRTFMRGIVALREYMSATLGATFTPVNTAPLTPGMLSISNVGTATPVGPGTGVAIAFTNPLANPDVVAFVQISPAFDTTRGAYKGPWDTSTNLAEEVASGTSEVISILGLDVDKVYFIHLRAIVKVGPHKITEDFIVRAIAETVL